MSSTVLGQKQYRAEVGKSGVPSYATKGAPWCNLPECQRPHLPKKKNLVAIGRLCARANGSLAHCLAWEGFVSQSLPSLPHPGLQDTCRSFGGDILLEEWYMCVCMCGVGGG